MCDLHSFIHRFRLKLKEIEFKIFNFDCNNGHWSVILAVSLISLDFIVFWV